MQDVFQLIRQTELQINQGSLRTAIETLRNLLALDPIMSQRTSTWRSASRNSFAPKRPPRDTMRSIEVEKIEEAEALELEALHDDPECVRAQVLLGELRFRRKDYDGARGFAVGALHIDPSHEGALTLLCLVKLQSKSVLWRWRECVRWVGRLHSAEQQELKRIGAVVAYVAMLILLASGHPWAAVATIAGLALLLVAAWCANRLVDRIFDRELRQVRFDRKY